MNHQEKQEEEERKPLRIEDIFTSDFKVQDDIKRVGGVCEFLTFINRQEVDLEEYKALKQAQLRNQDSRDRLPVNGAMLQRIPPVGCLNGNIGECCRDPFEKPLTKTDTDKHQTRLLMSKPFVEASFLPMLIAGESIMQGIPVTVYDSEGREFKMIFKIWGRKSYVLTSGGWGEWNKICTTNNLKEGDVIQVWMFRHANTGKLCFVLTYTRKGELKKKARVE